MENPIHNNNNNNINDNRNDNNDDNKTTTEEEDETFDNRSSSNSSQNQLRGMQFTNHHQNISNSSDTNTIKTSNTNNIDINQIENTIKEEREDGYNYQEEDNTQAHTKEYKFNVEQEHQLHKEGHDMMNQDLNNQDLNTTNSSEDNNLNYNNVLIKREEGEKLEDGEDGEDGEIGGEEDKDEGEVHSDDDDKGANDDDLEEGELKDDDDGPEHDADNHYQSNQHKLHQHYQSTNKQPSYRSSTPSPGSALLPTPRLPPRSSQPVQKSSICRYFSSNACTWGDSCRFLHIAAPTETMGEFVDSIRTSSSSRGPPPLPLNQPIIYDRDHHHIRHFSYSTSSSSSYHELHQSPQSPLPPHATPGYSNYRRHHNTTPPPIQSPAISPSANMSGSSRPPPPPLASSSMSSATRPYSSSSSTAAADYERRRRLAFVFAPRNDRREVPPPPIRDYPRASMMNGPHHRDIYPREHHREPIAHREYSSYPTFNQSSHRSSMSWSRSSSGPNHRTIPPDARRPHPPKRHYQDEPAESSWDESGSDDSLLGGASSDNSADRVNRGAINMGGTGTPTGEPLADDPKRMALMQQLEEVEEAIARKKAKHEVGEQE